MSVELRPLGVACNLACTYCYQNSERTSGNRRAKYDLEKMKAEAARIGGSFTLFGGEPLLMPFEDLEHLFAWGFEKFGGSAIQTNGVLLEERHIALFQRYKVTVGISIDGPGELNDARWRRDLATTRESTAKVEAAIERLGREYKAPGLIVTLHRGNATPDKLPVMADWLRRLHAMGVRSVRLHLLEVDDPEVRTRLALSTRENVDAILAIAAAQQTLPGMRMDLFEDMEHLLAADDAKVGCIWRACDPYTTTAVRGIEGNGQSSNCGRTNKEGVGFTKAAATGYERYVALYRTPQSENGCAGCRFFLMCKGQCPGTAIGGDWRNRTEHCDVWKHLFSFLERRMVLTGKHPVTLNPVRFDLERMQIEAWERGVNPSLSQLRIAWGKAYAGAEPAGPVSAQPTVDAPSPSLSAKPAALVRISPHRIARISWVSPTARGRWHPRFERVRAAIENMTVLAAIDRLGTGRCEARRVRLASLDRLQRLADVHAIATATLPPEALPTGVCATLVPTESCVLLAGTPEIVARARDAWVRGSVPEFHALLNLPACCLRHGAATEHPGMQPLLAGMTRLFASSAPHPLLAALGLSPFAILPCHLECDAAAAHAQERIDLWLRHGFAEEYSWLTECLGWAIAYSELHGVGEVKTPLFKAAFPLPYDLGSRTVHRAGTLEVEGGARGHQFPYIKPVRRPRALPAEALT